MKKIVCAGLEHLGAGERHERHERATWILHSSDANATRFQNPLLGDAQATGDYLDRE
jgi:hypothetical protein